MIALSCSTHSSRFTAALLSALALFLGSCVIPAQEAAKNQAEPSQNANAAQPRDAADGQNLIKPTIPPETAAPHAGDTAPAPVQKPIRVVVDKKEAQSSKRQEWEDQKVKAAATELAKSFPEAKKLKICYSAKYDEWWVTLYEDIGTLFDLRQFVWSREQERFQPHLVQQRIAKSALQHHLTEADPDQACEAMDPPPAPQPPPLDSDTPTGRQTGSPPADPTAARPARQ